MRVSVLRVEVTLIVATILNVAVAWGSALFIDGIPATRPGPIREGASHREQPRWEIRVYEQPGATVVTYRHLIRSPMAPPLNDHRDSALRDWVEAWRRHKLGLPPPSFYAPARTVISVPAWSGASRRPVADAVGISGFVEDARGWPCRSFISVAERVPGIYCARTQVIDLGRTQGPSGLPLVLPLRPLWPGFCANTLIFAAVLIGADSVARRLRRASRIRSGRCVSCGYPISASPVCTECGEPQPSACAQEMAGDRRATIPMPPNA